MSLEHRYRLLLEFGNESSRWINVLTKKQFKFPSGVDMKIQVAIASILMPLALYDVSNLSSITLEFKEYDGSPPTADSATLGSPIVGTIDDPDLTVVDWQNDVSQHATFTLSSTQSNIAAGTYWMAFSGVTTGPEIVSPSWGIVEIEEDGTGLTSPVDPLPPSYYTAAQVDALLAAQGGGGSPSIYDPDSYVEQTDATYIYFAWARLDGTGYLAKRRAFTTPDVVETNTGALPIPANLTVLNYN